MVLAGTLVIALLVLIFPGFVFSLVAGARVPVALAGSMPVTFGLIGFTAWMWGETSAPFTWVTVTIALISALFVAAYWRWAFARRAWRRGARNWREALWPGRGRAAKAARDDRLLPAWVIPAAGVVVSAWVTISQRLGWLVRLPHGVDNIAQGWDAQWHANVVRFIITEHVASPTRMGELQNLESKAPLLYPSAYHAVIALIAQAADRAPIPAVNISTALFVGVALPVSMACLVFTMLRSRGLTAQIGAALGAIAIFVAPPLWVAEFVSMWPYLVAACMVGTVVYLFSQVPAHHALALPTAVAFLGVLQVHPSVVTFIAIPVALFWLTSLLFRPERSRLQDTIWLALAALGGAALFLPQALAGSSQAEEVSGWGTPEDAGNTAPWTTVLTLSTRHVDDFFPGFSATTLLWLAGVGALVVVLWRRRIWPLLFYLFSAAVAVNALVPFADPLRKILGTVGALHYNTAHRLVLPVVMLTVAAAAIGLAAMVRLVCLAPLAARRTHAGWARASMAASLIVAVATGALTLLWVDVRSSIGAENAYSAARSGGRMVDDDDLLAFDWLATQPAAWDGYTMGDPADGHSWIYAYNGVPTIARHYLWPVGGRGSSTDRLILHADMIGAGLRGDPGATNASDRAIEDLNVKFFLLSPDPFWAQQSVVYEHVKALWTLDAVTPVYRKGTTVIFAVNDQFSASQLTTMQADARAHGSDEMPRLPERVSAAGVAW